jgi:hypothetical protein
MSEFPGRRSDKPRLPVWRVGYLSFMEREKEPYEGDEAKATGEDFDHIDPDELTGPGGRLPAAEGLTDADDPKDPA